MRLLLSFFVVSILSIFSFSVNAQSADQLISKHINAMGGESKWKAVKNLILTGEINQSGFSVGIKQTIVNGQAMRMDISAAGQNGYMIITQDSGWTYMPFMGQAAPEAIPMEEIKLGKDKINFTYSQLLDKKQIDSSRIIGKDTVSGKACTRVLVHAHDGNTLHCYIDNKTFYLLRMVTSIKLGDEEHEVVVEYNDFKLLPIGVTVPSRWTTPQGEVTFTSIEVNQQIDEKVFRP